MAKLFSPFFALCPDYIGTGAERSKESTADFDADLFLSQPSRGQNRRLELNSLVHFASINKQDGVKGLGYAPDAEWVLKMNYARVLGRE